MLRVGRGFGVNKSKINNQTTPNTKYTKTRKHKYTKTHTHTDTRTAHTARYSPSAHTEMLYYLVRTAALSEGADGLPYYARALTMMRRLTPDNPQLPTLLIRSHTHKRTQKQLTASHTTRARSQPTQQTTHTNRGTQEEHTHTHTNSRQPLTLRALTSGRTHTHTHKPRYVPPH